MSDPVASAPRRAWTLRRRLLLGIIGLLAVLSVVIGGVSVFALNASLTSKLDRELSDALGRGGAGLPAGAVVWSDATGESEGYRVGTDVTSGPDGRPSLESVDLSTRQKADLEDVQRTAEPTTAALDGLGLYRVIAFDSPRGAVAVGLPLSEVTSTVGTVALVVGIVVLAALALAFFAGTAIVRVALRPLDRVTATASAVSELPLDRGGIALEARVPEQDADPRTEVGRVGAAINRMLEHIAGALTARDASEQKLRAFVADASHELRTPLASIRGYSELTRRGGYDLPPDVVHALSRVESESIRMTSLVEDLLLLARLDDGRELEKQPVDVARLLADAVSDAHAAGQDHEWSLDLPDEPVHVLGDTSRLHQVVANLLANARVHTPAGTHVTTSAAIEGDRVVIRVIDDGPGIDPAVLPNVFERFARGDSSRARTTGSTGLGLAIVAAVVAAHDGEVSVESEPGRTAFAVDLARAPLPAG